MASTQVASTCPEPNTVPTTIHSLLLERLFIAAISALGSVTVTLGIIKWRVRKSRRVTPLLCRPSHCDQPAQTSFQEGYIDSGSVRCRSMRMRSSQKRKRHLQRIPWPWRSSWRGQSTA